MSRLSDRLVPLVSLWAIITVGCGGLSEPIEPEECASTEVVPSLPDLDPQLQGEGGDEGVLVPVEKPPPQSLQLQFAHTPGFHSDYFQLEFTPSHPDAEIYFTLDGSEPDPKAAAEVLCAPRSNGLSHQTFRYTGPIDLTAELTRDNTLSRIKTTTEAPPRPWAEPTQSVPKAAVVRARAVFGELTSPVITGTYFVDELGRARFNLPVVSLTTDARHLFDPETGIYVPGFDEDVPNFTQRGSEWERPAHVEYFDEHGVRPVAQAIGVRVHGNVTRSYPQKSLRLYARKEYGRSKLQYPFFEDTNTQQFKRLLLRNGGNDSNTLARDAAFQSLVHHLPMETQHASPSVLFINGEYWGVHMVQEYLDPFHLELRYGIPRAHITIIKNDAELSDGSEEDVAHYRAFLDELTNGNLNSAEEIDRYIALSEFVDYLVTELYSGNSDWPHNNIGFWRYSKAPIPATTEDGPRDGRWRPLLFDMDRTLGRQRSTEVDMINLVLGEQPDPWSRRLIHGLLRVEWVRDELIQRMAVHLATTFRAERVDAAVMRYTRAIEPAMPEHIKRWNLPQSMDAYYSAIELARHFAAERPTLVRQHMTAFFAQISGTAQIRIHNIDPENPPTVHGTRLTTDTPGVVIKDGTWEGTVFSGVPFVLQPANPDWSSPTIEGEALLTQVTSDLRLTLSPDTVVDVRL